MNKLVGLKNSTMKMKWIKPSTLSKIFSIDANSLSKEENATDPIAL